MILKLSSKKMQMLSIVLLCLFLLFVCIIYSKQHGTSNLIRDGVDNEIELIKNTKYSPEKH